MITITVTAEDIANGKTCNSRECPIALAVRRILTTALVGPCFILIEGVGVNEQDTRIVLPSVARNFVSMFDGDKKVEPFSFQIEEPNDPGKANQQAAEI